MSVSASLPGSHLNLAQRPSHYRNQLVTHLNIFPIAGIRAADLFSILCRIDFFYFFFSINRGFFDFRIRVGIQPGNIVDIDPLVVATISGHQIAPLTIIVALLIREDFPPCPLTLHFYIIGWTHNAIGKLIPDTNRFKPFPVTTGIISGNLRYHRTMVQRRLRISDRVKIIWRRN